jgi:hypothetical protein
MDTRDFDELYKKVRSGAREKKSILDEVKQKSSKSKTLTESYKSVHIKEARIAVKFEDDPEVKNLTLSDEYAKRVLGYANVMAENAEDIIKEWVSAGGWGSVAQDAIVPVLLRLFQKHYNLDDINNTKSIIRGIKDLVNYKDKLKSFHKALVSDNEDLYYFLSLTQQQLPSTQIFSPEIIDQIKNIVFAEGGVSVGEGEVMITLFSEAINPKKGDLEIEGVGEVELKGPAGRAGKGAVISASAKALKEINKTLVDTTPRLKEQTINDMFILTEPITSIKSEIDRVSKLRSSKAKVNYLELLKALIKKDKRSTEKLIKLTPAVAKNVIQVGSGFLQINTEALNGYESKFQQINSELLEKINYYNNIKIQGHAVNFGSYFRIYKGTKAVDMLSKFSHKQQNDIKPIIAKYYGELNPDQIAAAIQIAGYQENEGFKFIAYFNGNTNKLVSIGPFTNNYVQNLEITLQKADKFKKVSTNLGGDAKGGGRGGFNVTV